MTEFPYFTLPYKEFIRFLNGGEYLDTFEVGSRTIDPISWPTIPRKTNICSKRQLSDDVVREILERSWIDPKKFELTGTGLKKDDRPNNYKFKNMEESKRVTKTTPWQPTPADEAQVERILEDMLDADLPPMLDDLDEICFIPEKVTNETACMLKKMSYKVSKDEGIKLENSKRKLGQQYEHIENEKKRRRIQVIEFQKPQPRPQAQSKKPPVLKELNETCYIPEKVANETDCRVKKMSIKVSDEDDETKLENSKKKLKQLYEQIENEKKRRRIQVIEFQRPQPPQAQSKKPPVKKQQSKRANQLLIPARKLYSVY